MKNKKLLISSLIVLVLVGIIFTVPMLDIMYQKYDVNGDEIINHLDLAEVFFQFGKPYDSTYDVNEDGVVNHIDLASVFFNFGEDPTVEDTQTIVEWISEVTWGN